MNLIIYEIRDKLSVEQGRVVTILNIIKHYISYLVYQTYGRDNYLPEPIMVRDITILFFK